MEVIQLSLGPDESIAFMLDIHADSTSPSSRIDDIQETLMEKLESVKTSCVSNNVKHLFIAGDIFNRVATTHGVVNQLGSKFLEFRELGISVYSILGNHDIVRNSLEAIEKSPTQTMFSFGVMKHLNLSTRVIINRKVMITPCDYTEYPVPADKSAQYNILLAHMFYDASELMADERHNLTKKAIDKLGYDMVVLGHDHTEYPPVVQGKSTIYRFGAVLRGTAHSYNFTRKPQFMVMKNLDSPSTDNVLMCEIAHRPYQDVASEYVLNKKTTQSVSGLQDVLSNLAEKLAETGEAGGDRIFDIISTDPDLPNDCRALLLKYINEQT